MARGHSTSAHRNTYIGAVYINPMDNSPAFVGAASGTTHTRKTLSEIRLGGLSIDLKGWNQLWYYGESIHEPRN